MAIKQPTVEVTQEAVTTSVIVQEPTLDVAIAGAAYKVHDLALSDTKYDAASSNVISFPKLIFPGVAAENEVPDATSVYVLLEKGVNWSYLRSSTFTVTPAADEVTAPTITIPATELSASYSATDTIYYEKATKEMHSDLAAYLTGVAVGDKLEVYEYYSDVIASFYGTHATGAQQAVLDGFSSPQKGDYAVTLDTDTTQLYLWKYSASGWAAAVGMVGGTVSYNGANQVVRSFGTVTGTGATLTAIAALADRPLQLIAYADITVVGSGVCTIDVPTEFTTTFEGLDDPSGATGNITHVVKIQRGDSWNLDGASIRVGYVANLGSGEYENLYGFSDIAGAESVIGEADVRNPLGLAYSIANANGVAQVLTYAMKDSGTVYQRTSNVDFSGAADALELHESAYAICYLTQDQTASQALQSHVETMSDPSNSSERIAWISRDVSSLTTNKTTRFSDATQIALVSQGIGSRRVFNVFPPKNWIKQVWAYPVINEWLDPLNSSSAMSVYAAKVYSYTDSNSGELKEIKVGQEITQDLLALLDANQVLEIYIEVPGIYSAVSEAAKTAVVSPAQPHTNTEVKGIDRVIKSSDWFTKTQLDVIAGGGTYIIHQPNTLVAPSVRHHLSTDVTSGDNAELNVTKQVDFASKYYRNIIKPYIGKSVISEKLISIITFLIKGAADYLVRRNQYLEDAQLVSIERDANAKDTLNIVIKVKPYFALNYVYITIQY